MQNNVVEIPSDILESMLEGINEQVSPFDYTITGDTLNSPFNMAINPFESVFMKENSGFSCLKVLIIVLLVFLIYKCFTKKSVKKESYTVLNDIRETVTTSPVCGKPCPVQISGNSGLTSKDLQVCKDWEQDKLDNSNIQSFGGFVCNYK